MLLRRGLLAHLDRDALGKSFVTAELYMAFRRRGGVVVSQVRFEIADSIAELIRRYRDGTAPLTVESVPRPITDRERERFKKRLRRRPCRPARSSPPSDARISP